MWDEAEAVAVDLNEKQKKALACLARAFAICRKAGLVFVGMGDELLAFDGKDIVRLETNEHLSLLNAMRKLDCGEQVVTYGTYLDSGGW